MDMTGERRIPAPRETVWQALNDPEVLKASIPGCESLEKLSDNEMKATAAVRIGPISARFTGNVHLTDIDPPNGYTISGEGQGGVAGFAKGGAKVRPGGRRWRHAAALRRACAGRRQDRPARRPADRRLRQADGGRLLRPVQRVRGPPGTRCRLGHRGTQEPRRAPPPPPSAISPLALVPREPFGLPLVAWIGGVIYLFILILILGSLI